MKNSPIPGKFPLLLFSLIFFCSLSEAMEIRPIESHQIEQARDIIINAALEFEIMECAGKDELTKILAASGELDDLDHIPEVYTLNRGVFMVMLNGTQVIGMGAIQYFDTDTCELRRVFFAPEYRGQGLGSRMATKLLQIAQELGYKKIRLTLYSPKQTAALRLYKKLGFYVIPAYNNNPKIKLSMERILP